MGIDEQYWSAHIICFQMIKSCHAFKSVSKAQIMLKKIKLMLMIFAEGGLWLVTWLNAWVPGIMRYLARYHGSRYQMRSVIQQFRSEARCHRWKKFALRMKWYLMECVNDSRMPKHMSGCLLNRRTDSKAAGTEGQTDGSLTPMDRRKNALLTDIRIPNMGWVTNLLNLEQRCLFTYFHNSALGLLQLRAV